MAESFLRETACTRLWSNQLEIIGTSSSVFRLTINGFLYLIPSLVYLVVLILFVRKAIALKGDENSIRRFVHILCWCITFLLLLRFIEHGLIHKMHQSSVKVLPAAIQMMFNVAFFVVELFLYTWFLYGSMSNEDKSSKRITIWVFLATAINIVTQGFIIHFNYDKIKTNPYYYYDMNTFWILIHGLWLIMYLFLVVTRRAVIYRDIKEWRHKGQLAQLSIFIFIHLILFLGRLAAAFSKNSNVYCFLWTSSFIYQLSIVPILYTTFLFKPIHKASDIYVSSEAITSSYVKEIRYSRLKTINS